MDLTRRQGLLCLAALAGSACRRPQRAARPRVDAGPVARRIVSLVPGVTEAFFAVGAGPRVVGVSNFCDWPAEASRLPRVGSMVAPAVDAIERLRPDALAGVQGPVNLNALARLRGAGVRTVFPAFETIADVRAAIPLFAALGGKADEGGALLDRADATLARLRAALGDRPRPRVVAVQNLEPLVVAGHGSWVDGLLALAGAENAVGSGTRNPLLTIEQVQGLVPEVILDLTPATSPPLETAWAAYAAMPAVQNHHVLRPDAPWVARQGPRFAEAAALLARALHPGLRL